MKDFQFIISRTILALVMGVLISILFHEIAIRFMDYMGLGSGYETLNGSLLNQMWRK